MLKKLIYEEVYNRFKEKGFELLDKTYNKNNTRMNCIDKEGYKYFISVLNLKTDRSLKFYKTNPYREYNIQHFLDIESNGSKLVSINGNNSKNIEISITCERCGKEIHKKYESIIINKSFLCLECFNKDKRHKQDFIKNEFSKYGLNLIGEYTLNNIPIDCIDEDGYRLRISYANLRYAKTPYKFSMKFNADNYLYNVNNYFKINNINCKAMEILDEEYSNTNNIIIAKCECGKLFKTSIAGISSNQVRCEKCSHSISNGEYLISKWLVENNIEYERQKRFDDCRNIRPLPFDFYLTKLNYCIEMDGSQHTFPSSFSERISPEKQFEIIKTNDEIKNRYCEENDIGLLRISYNDIRRINNNYINILSNKFIKK